jgi:CIC family chloride channel protein
MAATVGAASLTRATVGAGPIYGQRAFGLESSLELLSFAALGVASAAVALAFKFVLGALENWFDTHPVPQPFRAMLGGLLVGLIAIWMPAVVGNGYEPLNRILDSGMAINGLILLVVAKTVATSGSVASGIPGGVFTPMLLVGGCTGAAWSDMVSFAIGQSSDAGSYALVGMAAATAASIHAPLTAAVMVFELSGDYPIALPLIVATIVATAASKAAGGESVYEAELRKRGLGWEITLEGRQMKVPSAD